MLNLVRMIRFKSSDTVRIRDRIESRYGELRARCQRERDLNGDHEQSLSALARMSGMRRARGMLSCCRSG